MKTIDSECRQRIKERVTSVQPHQGAQGDLSPPNLTLPLKKKNTARGAKLSAIANQPGLSSRHDQ